MPICPANLLSDRVSYSSALGNISPKLPAGGESGFCPVFATVERQQVVEAQSAGSRQQEEQRKQSEEKGRLVLRDNPTVARNKSQDAEGRQENKGGQAVE